MGETDARVLIRDAATIIVLRDGDRVLMGQRGAAASFMPSKFVFPGGAVDAVDAEVPVRALAPACRVRLSGATAPEALAAAAIRELWEEAGLILGAPAAPWTAPRGWRGYAATGHVPDGSALRFVFRAITPPGRPRRFDARFFLADAADLASDPDDFARAEPELAHLQWVPLDRARAFDLPFITEVVLAELAAIQAGTARPGVPFFDNTGEVSRFERL